MASSPTLFPAEFVREVENTLDAVPAISYEEVKKVVESELGPLSDTYASFDREPVAAASVAQVHRATLKDGRVVAVKVLRPGVDNLLKAGFRVLGSHGQGHGGHRPRRSRACRLPTSSRTCDLPCLMNLDLRKEADNLEVFDKWLVESQLDGVATCPLPVREACSNEC